MSESRPVLIYAELLSRIQGVSVGCELYTPSSLNTKAAISSDGWFFTIHHDGIETSIRLPGQVVPVEQLPIQSVGKKHLSCRLPLASGLERHVLSALGDQPVPWSASDLLPESPILCRSCRNTIVKPGIIKVWKDLPSENWAEMMEFWHCHKPHDHGHKHDDDDGSTSKAYGANSRISAQDGVGFVDISSFLLSETNISTSTITKDTTLLQSQNELEVEDTNSRSLQPENIPVSCVSCKNQLGILNGQGSAVTLFKWQVYVDERIPRGPDSSPNLVHWVSAMLLATMARSGCSKSILLPMKLKDSPAQSVSQTNEASQSLLNIWVFNNISFSSTGEPRSPIKAVKVFYRMVSQGEADKLLDSVVSDVQDITLPADAIEKVKGILNSNNQLLPQSDRQFKEWKVSLLEKWEGKDG
ncbi:ubiquitin-conjugating enzyme E2-binding protein [Daldinia caldariorum]|uniref:ubiquitin-conjugating enzyme E2-binding protein n=1 Tax=Daldinia caldariorum TaxID=326644 RepID=UPI0020088B76|nr:ubiquitin-conjugating enzyme E2-binding protein [Daldinia caldariorum]KAI1470414.1 ubiquitin-conjugating enzyme E2-binding protein [Daldinia caldariorum]